MGEQTLTVQEVVAYKCQECEAISEEVGETLYECLSCGTTFTKDNSADGVSHRCPDCNKFASKRADKSCIECSEGEVDDIGAYSCPVCDELYEEEHEARDCCKEDEKDK